MLKSYHYHSYSYSDSNIPNDLVKTTPRSVFKIPQGAPQNETTDRAMYWRNNGKVGLSSLTIWCHLMNAKHPEADKVEWSSHPFDVDDFSRCYLLLEAVPEWKEEIYSSSLPNCSKTWELLIMRWSELTKLYEENNYHELYNLLKQIQDQTKEK